MNKNPMDVSPSLQQKAMEKHLQAKQQKNEIIWKDLPAVIIRANSTDSTENSIHYIRGKYLGKGGCARVYELQDSSTGEIYAGKIIAKQTLTRRSKYKLLTEIQIHRTLDHPSIVQYIDFFEDNRFVYILLELCSHKSLMKLIRYRHRLSEDEIRYYLKDIFEALEHLKSHRIIHRDLKLGNLLLDANMKVKIVSPADFGLAAKLSQVNERKKTICGTPNYIAPEILKGQGQGHSFEVDIWSMGVITYTLLVGKPPFESKDFKITYERITGNIYSFPEDIEISVNAKNLIRECLHPDAACRPSVQEILNHPFFTDQIIPNSVPVSSMRFPPHRKPDETRTSDMFWEESVTPTAVTKPFIFAGPKKISKAPLAPTTLNTAILSPTLPSRKRKRNVSSLYPAQGNENDSEASQVNVSVGKVAPQAMTLEAELQLDTILKTLNELVDRKNSDEESHTKTGNLNLQPVQYENHLYVSRWVDESKRVGIGFQLSNEITCVYFNDDTKMAFDPVSHYFHYWEPKIDKETRTVLLNEATQILFHLSSLPETLRKKTEILLHFRHYFIYQKNSGHMEELRADMQRRVVEDGSNVNSCVHVQRFIRTKHAMTFKLSDGTVQTNFFDHTKIVTHTNENFAVFISSKGESRFFALDTFDHADKLVSSRVRYVRDSVATMVRIRHHVLPVKPKFKSSPSAKRRKISH